MNKVYSLIISFLITAQITAQNIAINTTGASANASAMLDIASTSSGLLIPRMTSTERTAIVSPATGLLVFDATMNSFYFYNGTAWQMLTGSSNGWGLTGNTATTAGTNFIGTTDAVDFVAKTNNIERIRVTSAGNFGIGTATPNAPLQFANTVANRKIVLWETGNDDHQFYGLGINGSVLRYQVDNASASHVFYAGSGSSSSNELMRIQGNGNVGIGTPNPVNMLQVNSSTNFSFLHSSNSTSGSTGLDGAVFGTLDENAFVYNREIGSLYFGTSNLPRVTIDPTGNVGIGTLNPVNMLQVNSPTNLSFIHSSNSTTGSTGLDGAVFGTLDGNAYLYNRENAPLEFGTNNSTRMIIDPNGNVGIGTFSPANMLQVNSSTNFSYIHSSNSTTGSTGADGSVFGMLDLNAYVYNREIGPIHFGTSNSTRMTVDPNGNVGIGTETPAAKLEVLGSLRIGNDVWHTSTDGLLRSYYETNGSNFYVTGNGFNFQNSSYTHVFNILNNGNVGIGTTNPVNKLQVNSSTSTSFLHSSNSTSGSTGFDGAIFGTINENAYLYNRENSPLYFGTNNLNRMTIDANGDVGIGTATPAAKLHVAGTLRVGNDVWHTSADGKFRTFYGSNGSSYYGSANDHIFRNPSDVDCFAITDLGSVVFNNNVSHYSMDGASRFFFDAGGTTSFSTPNSTFQYSGSGLVQAQLVSGKWYASGYLAFSDQRLKKDITPLNNALNKVLQMQAFNYLYRQDVLPKTSLDDKPQIGFIAQDVEKIFPHMVTTREDGYKAIDYSKMTPVLVEAIKEQQKIIDDLKKEMQDLKSMVESLREK